MEEQVIVHIKIARQTRAQLKAKVAMEHKTLQEKVSELIEDYVKRGGK